MKKIIIICLLSCSAISGFSTEKRDILQKESNEIELENVLFKDFSEIGLPTYKDRDFWNRIPENLNKQYILQAEEKLDYEWPVVKAHLIDSIVRPCCTCSLLTT